MKSILYLSLIIPLLFPAQDMILDHGGGEYYNHQGECLTTAQRAAIEEDIELQKRSLEELGLLEQSDRSSIIEFSLPIQGSEELDWNNIYGISNYVDQVSGGDIGDYNCGQRTYNGHLGTDYFTWPFGHYLKENDLAEVVAAAPGTIIQKLDGMFDEQCDLNATLTWNAVYISHADGSVAWYGHLKEGSLTTKAIGETVEQGEYLGIVASSGFSSGPHLHFEIHDVDNNIIDPYTGSCNSLNTETWWLDQDTYTRMELNTHLTHDEIPEHGCPSEFENPHFQSYFNNSDIVYLVPYFKDQDPSTVVTYTVLNPFGTLYTTWEHSSDQYYNSSWWYWTLQMPLLGGEGTWTFRIQFDGQTYDRLFFLGDPPVGLQTAELPSFSIGPNPAFDILTISGGEDILSYRITDISGRLQ
ncbi:MAG: M23 family metallopeptidase, partial [Flavobacteriales bacterium]|nr:M23 family metallopeptidase [Flavobacteriales bacterium]